VVAYTTAQSPPFSRKIGIDTLAKPAFLLSPAQAFSQQQIVDATAFDANAFDFIEVCF
jgi:hypothetical protein